MTDLVFVDTNVIVYTRDRQEPSKAKRAAEWLKTLDDGRALVVSPQVVNEAVTVSQWKFKDVPKAVIREWAKSLLPYCTAPLDRDVVSTALDLHGENALHWWDCVIVASAIASNCRYLLSEDLTHGQVIRTLRVLDPFQLHPSDLSTIG